MEAIGPIIRERELPEIRKGPTALPLFLKDCLP